MSHAAKQCGECHTDTLFQWQSSQHGESDLTCINCHDPHGTDLKTADTSELCASCHGTRVAAFGHSVHAAKGLTCTDCHIGEAEGELGMGRARHTHTFAVDLDTCNECHESERPRSHTLRFERSTHGRTATADRESCAACHQADFCQACHEVPPPGHTPAFRAGDHGRTARVKTRSCLTCHAFEEDCARCHNR